jgi:hypothetical protein
MGQFSMEISCATGSVLSGNQHSLRYTDHIFFNKAGDLSEVLIQNKNLWIR